MSTLAQNPYCWEGSTLVFQTHGHFGKISLSPDHQNPSSLLKFLPSVTLTSAQPMHIKRKANFGTFYLDGPNHNYTDQNNSGKTVFACAIKTEAISYGATDTDSTLPEAWEGGEGRIYTKDREMLLWVESSALQEYHFNGKNRMQGAWLCSSSPNPSASSLPSKNLAFRESAHYFCELVHFVDSKHSKENTSFFVFSKYSLGGTLCFSSFPTPDPLSFFFPFGPPITVIGLVRHTLSGF